MEQKSPQVDYFAFLVRSITSLSYSRATSTIQILGTSLVVRGLGLCTSIVGGMGLSPGWRIKISHNAQHSQNSFFLIKKKKKTIQTFCSQGFWGSHHVLDYHSGPCYWWHHLSRTWWARSSRYLKCLGKTQVWRQMGNKRQDDSTQGTVWKSSRVGWTSSKVKDKLFYFISPNTTKK